MKINEFGSRWTYVPEGCKLCWQGAKLVLFVTGRCNQKCFYCPISEEKKNKDVIFANERPCFSTEDAVQEAKEMLALGAGITGGEPFLAVDKCLNYITAFKKEFGKQFHIHLYTYGNGVTPETLSALEAAGLDEIRFHTKKNIELALKTNMRVGLEVPVIPDQEEYLMSLVNFVKEKDIFLNLNEFEFSDTNWDEMEKRGFRPINNLSYAVKGSRELALRVLKYARRIGANAHFCTVRYKNAGQLTERLKRRASTIRKPWQKVRQDGLLEYCVVECTEKEAAELKLAYNKREKGGELATEQAKAFKKKGRKVWKVLEYPVYEPWTFEKEPL